MSKHHSLNTVKAEKCDTDPKLLALSMAIKINNI